MDRVAWAIAVAPTISRILPLRRFALTASHMLCSLRFLSDVWCGRFLGGTGVCDVRLFCEQRFSVFTILCDGVPLCTMCLGQPSCRILPGHILLACVVVDVVSDACVQQLSVGLQHPEREHVAFGAPFVWFHADSREHTEKKNHHARRERLVAEHHQKF